MRRIVDGTVRGACRMLSAGAAVGIATAAQAQWTVINLHPAGATESDARAVWGAEQVGVRNLYDGALMWNGSASTGHLLPATSGTSKFGNTVYGGWQGGTVQVGEPGSQRDHGAIWGPNGLFVDLHPGAAMAIHTAVAAMDDQTQGGSFFSPDDGGGFFTLPRPCLWHGTPESFVDLTPLGFTTGEVRGVFGNQQVGATFDGLAAAAMWTGTAESYVSLQPEDAFASAAGCTDGVNQYGAMFVIAPEPAFIPVRWSGTAESWVNMGVPAGRAGEVHATHGGYQVGRTSDPDGASNTRACIWTAGPGSHADLHPFVPAGFVASDALGIWRHMESGTTYVVGYGVNSDMRQQALMWVNGPGVNLIVSPSGPAGGPVSVGQSFSFGIRVLNAGPLNGDPVTLTVDLPAAAIATFVEATPAPASVTATQLVFNLGAIGASGGLTDVTVTLNAAGAGTASITAAASASGEVDPTNNTGSVSTVIEPAACPPDFNGSGGVSVQDIFDFLAAYFANEPGADFNGAGGITVQDIFDYLAAYFTGCP